MQAWVYQRRNITLLARTIVAVMKIRELSLTSTTQTRATMRQTAPLAVNEGSLYTLWLRSMMPFPAYHFSFHNPTTQVVVLQAAS